MFPSINGVCACSHGPFGTSIHDLQLGLKAYGLASELPKVVSEKKHVSTRESRARAEQIPLGEFMMSSQTLAQVSNELSLSLPVMMASGHPRHHP